LLIEAFNKVIKSNKKASLLIIGEGALLNQLKSVVNQYGINDQVFFIGKVPHNHVHEYINQMDVCVMPGSNWYGSPIKIFEYAVLGKAIVAPNNSPLRDVMVNEEDGLLVETNTEMLAEALIKLIDSPQLRKSLGQNFKNKVLSDYTWKSAAQLIISAYKNEL
jgi:glycosyltransferase involved in cell wall biosynthesis